MYLVGLAYFHPALLGSVNPSPHLHIHTHDCVVQVVAEWELFLLTSVGYNAAARRASRARLLAIQDRDRRQLAQLHAEVDIVLSTMGAAPTPTPLPVPTPVHPASGLSHTLIRSHVARNSTHF